MFGSWKKRVRLAKRLWINLSASKRNGPGASASTKLGPATVNSRGRISVRLPGGLTWRGRWR